MALAGCSRLIAGPFAPAAFLSAAAIAHPHGASDNDAHTHDSGWVHENGIGADPDNDSNPATDSSATPFVFDAAAADDPPFKVITFEPPPGRHGEAILGDYEEKYGVTFSEGLSWQICEGQRHFEYDTMCTYDAAPSGRFAAGYRSDLNAPLVIEFSRPVCVVTMAIYPTGGKDNELYECRIEAWNEAGEKLPHGRAEFHWTDDTVRWRNMAGVYYLDRPAKRIAISISSTRRIRIEDGGDYIEEELPENERYDEEEKKRKTRDRVVRWLLDDLAFVETGCEEAMQSIVERAGGLLERAAAEDPLDAATQEAIDSVEVSGL